MSPEFCGIARVEGISTNRPNFHLVIKQNRVKLKMVLDRLWVTPVSLRGGQAFFRVIISFGLGLPEVALYMTGTFGEVFGPRNRTGSEPRPARK